MIWKDDYGREFVTRSNVKDNFRAEKNDLEIAVMIGAVDTHRFINPNHPTPNKAFTAYLLSDIIRHFVRRKKYKKKHRVQERI